MARCKITLVSTRVAGEKYVAGDPDCLWRRCDSWTDIFQSLLIVKLLVLLHFVIQRFPVDIQKLGSFAFVEIYFLQSL